MNRVMDAMTQVPSSLSFSIDNILHGKTSDAATNSKLARCIGSGGAKRHASFMEKCNMFKNYTVECRHAKTCGSDRCLAKRRLANGIHNDRKLFKIEHHNGG